MVTTNHMWSLNILIVTSTNDKLIVKSYLSCVNSNINIHIGSVQFSAVAQSCPTMCDPIDCSVPGLPVHHQLPEFT